MHWIKKTFLDGLKFEKIDLKEMKENSPNRFIMEFKH